MNKTQREILKQVLYYDIFDHPLTREEIFKDHSGNQNEDQILDDLLERGMIFRHNGHFSVKNDPDLSIRRKVGEENASMAMPEAIKKGGLIQSFPYVKAVALSGSISKGYMDSFKDVDYFIITKPHRLWLSRILLVFYKRVFLSNSYRYFCLNYFLDENNLEIEEHNRFTATEIDTMIPLTGTELLGKLFDRNEWVSDFYPGFGYREITIGENSHKPLIIRAFEVLTSNFIGNWLDLASMKVTVWYWKVKYRKDSQDLFGRSFKLRRDVAKYHPGNFQHRILDKYRANVKEYEREMNVSLGDAN